MSLSNNLSSRGPSLGFWYENGSSIFTASASFLNLIALGFLFYQLGTPYLLNSSIDLYQGRTETKLGVGILYASAARNTFLCQECEESTPFLGQRVKWSEITSELACTNNTNIYEKWSGVYGFCDKVNGKYSKPVEFSVMLIFTFISMLLVSCCIITPIIWEGKNFLKICICVSFSGFVCSVIPLCMIAYSTWMQDILSGNGVLIFRNTRRNLYAVNASFFALSINHTILPVPVLTFAVMGLFICAFISMGDIDENGDNGKADTKRATRLEEENKVDHEAEINQDATSDGEIQEILQLIISDIEKTWGINRNDKIEDTRGTEHTVKPGNNYWGAAIISSTDFASILAETPDLLSSRMTAEDDEFKDNGQKRTNETVASNVETNVPDVV